MPKNDGSNGSASWRKPPGTSGRVQPRLREVGDGVLAVGKQLPELLGRVNAAGEAAGHGDDGDGVVRGDIGLLQVSR